MAIEIKIMKRGNSVRIIIPSETANKLNLKPEDTVIIEIMKKTMC